MRRRDRDGAPGRGMADLRRHGWIVAAVAGVVAGAALVFVFRSTPGSSSHDRRSASVRVGRKATTTTTAHDTSTGTGPSTDAPTVAPPSLPGTTAPPTATVPTRPAAPAASEPGGIAVPALVGLRLDAATARATGANLHISWPEHCDDVVRSQSPPAGTVVAVGSTVTVELVPCIVPSVIGLHLEAAKAAIAAAGLHAHWPAYCDDLVTGQSPAAGSRVAPATVVSMQLKPPGTC